MRSQIASQVGDLIWNLPPGPGERAAVTVPGDSLAAVLAIAEECVARHRGRAQQNAAVRAALAELRAALPDAAARSETANETRNEPTGWAAAGRGSRFRGLRSAVHHRREHT